MSRGSNLPVWHQKPVSLAIPARQQSQRKRWIQQRTAVVPRTALYL